MKLFYIEDSDPKRNYVPLVRIAEIASVDEGVELFRKHRLLNMQHVQRLCPNYKIDIDQLDKDCESLRTHFKMSYGDYETDYPLYIIQEDDDVPWV